MSIGELIAIGSMLLGCGGLIVKVRQLEAEVDKLRAWHHKIGDNPTERWAQALDILVKRIDRLEK